MNKILILSEDSEKYYDLLLKAGLKKAQIHVLEDLRKDNKGFDQINIVFGDPDLIKKVWPKLNNLQWVQSTWAGVTPLIEINCKKNYILTGVKDVFGSIMSEYITCYMLMNERKALERFSSQKDKKWDRTPPGLLREKKIGILGTGSIGCSIAKTAKFFKMKTKGYSRTSRSCEYIDEWSNHNDKLVNFVKDLDYIVSTLPDTYATTKLLNRPVFKAMKSNAFFINVGRGNVLEDAALVEAAENGWISGAVLDVFKKEPLPVSHPFWNTPGIIITSHTAAMSYPEDIAPIFIENYHRFQSEKPLKYLLNLKRGY